MGDKTGIEWTQATWNPWHGCTKVSPGCKNCYMFREKKQYGQDPETVVKSKTKFDAPLSKGHPWNTPRLVFTCSWSDWFHEDADEWRPAAWEIIRQTPQHTYQILTKRPERIKDHLPPDWGRGWDNVWMGVSVESQQYAHTRIPLLAAVPAKVRFLSCEPLLGPLALDVWLNRRMIHWVIGGGESGPQFRIANIEWARSLRDQCVQAKVPFFWKQWSGVNPKKLGRVLDGKVWSQMPKVRKIQQSTLGVA